MRTGGVVAILGTINVYGLVKYDDDELLHIDTSNEIDLFELKL